MRAGHLGRIKKPENLPLMTATKAANPGARSGTVGSLMMRKRVFRQSWVKFKTEICLYARAPMPAKLK